MTATVTPATDKKLRDAMQRLLSGQSTRTDGRLTKANLHIEAGVSRATMNRAGALLTEWDAAVCRDITPRSRRVAELEAMVTKLKKTLAELRQANTELRRKNQAAATVIAELSAQIEARSATHAATVIPLPKRQRRSPW